MTFPEWLMLMLFFFASITGIGYFIYCVQHKFVQYTVYPDYIMERAGLIPALIRYSKDIITVIICIVLFWHSLKFGAKKLLIYFVFFCLYGGAISLFNGLNFSVIFSGIRSFLYIFTGVWFFQVYGLSYYFIDSLKKVTIISITANLLSVLIFIGMGGKLPGSGTYRYIGLFLHTGTLGNYVYGASFFLSAYYLKTHKISKFLLAICQLFCIILCFACNSRLCTAGTIVNIIVTIMCSIQINTKVKNIVSLFSLAILVPFILEAVLDSSGRGGLEASASGKNVIWAQVFEETPMHMLFGYGLGAASSTTIALNGNVTSYTSFEGTFSVVVAQFGLVGLAIFLVLFCYILIMVIKCRYFNEFVFKVNFVCGIIIFAYSGSIFENILMCLYCSTIYYLFNTPDCNE